MGVKRGVKSVNRLMLADGGFHRIGQHKAGAKFCCQFIAAPAESVQAHAVNELHRAAGPGRKTDAEDRADIGVVHGGQHAFIQAAVGFKRLTVEHAVFHLKNMNPGPTLFTTNPQNIYAIFLLFIVTNLIMIPLGILCIKVSSRILKVPRNILMPLILLFCMVGTFAINNSLFEIVVMLVAGLVAYLLEENRFPIAPAILGVVLGSALEENFITSPDLRASWVRQSSAAGSGTPSLVAQPASEDMMLG